MDQITRPLRQTNQTRSLEAQANNQSVMMTTNTQLPVVALKQIFLPLPSLAFLSY